MDGLEKETKKNCSKIAPFCQTKFCATKLIHLSKERIPHLLSQGLACFLLMDGLIREGVGESRGR